MNDAETEDSLEELCFFGEYEHSLDAQCRIAVPSEWRSGSDMQLVLLPGRSRDLLLFPFETFREFLKRARRISLADRKVQEALARIGARARKCKCDKQGRIKLERPMLDAIGIGSQVKLVGALTHIKLCAPDSWVESQNRDDDAYLDEFDAINKSLGGFNNSFLEALRGGN